MITITLCLWQALKTQEQLYLAQASKIEAEHVKYRIKNEITNRQRELIAMAGRWESGVDSSMDEWLEDARSYLNNQKGNIAIIHFEADLNTYFTPTDQPAVIASVKQLLRTEFNGGLQSPGIALGRLFPPNRELLYWVPLYSQGKKFDGLIVQAFNLKELLDAILSDVTTRQYNISIFENEERLYSNALSSKDKSTLAQTTLSFPDMQWDIQVWQNSLPPQESSRLPFMALGLGLLIAFLTSSTSYLSQLTRLRKTELEHTLHKLFISTQHNQTILNSMSEGLLELGTNGQIQFVNQASLQMLGYENSQELIGSKMPLKLSFSNAPSQFESSFDRKDKSSFPVEYSSTPIVENGIVTGHVIVFRDITKKQAAEKEIQLTQNLFRSLIDKTTALIFVKDLSFNYVIVNKSFLEFFNLTEDEIINKNDYDIFPKSIADRLRRYDQKVFFNKESSTVEEAIPGPNGEHTFISVKFPLFDDRNKVYALCGMSTDITERKLIENKAQDYLRQVETTNKELGRVNQELELAHKESDKANRAKGFFLATMNHEIQTPLNAIVELTSLLLKTSLTNQQANYLSSIHLGGKLLNELIHDIIDFSKIEAGELKLEYVSVNFAELIKGIADLLGIKAEEKKIEFAIFFAPNTPCQVLTDFLRLGQVLINLISNAIKFTKKGYVRVSSSCVERTEKEARIRFEIVDTGIGISPDNQLLLEGDSFKPEFNGSRLGLAISKQLVELMKGQIGYYSEEREGSTFWFEIPFTLASDYNLATEALNNQDNRLAGKFVLLVQDQEINAQIIEQYLDYWGASYKRGDSIEVALQFLKESQQTLAIDFILISYQLVDESGIDFAAKVREMPAYRQTVIIFLTSLQLSAHLQSKPQALIVTLTKPIYPPDLFRILLQ